MTLRRLLVCLVVTAGLAGVALVARDGDSPGETIAAAADKFLASLDDKQKQTFINEMVRLSHERGLD